MNNFKKTFFGLAASGTLAISLSTLAIQSYAQSNDFTNTSETSFISAVPEGSAKHGPKLGLTDEQMEQLVSLKSDYAVNTAKQKAELKADRKKLILLMTDPKLDKQAVLSLNEKIKSLKSDLSDARVNRMLSAMEVMTPQQKEQIRHRILAHALSRHHSIGKGGKYQKGGDHQHRSA